MDYIIFSLQALKEDKPYLIITDDFIKEWIEENIDKLVEEIRDEL